MEGSADFHFVHLFTGPVVNLYDSCVYVWAALPVMADLAMDPES